MSAVAAFTRRVGLGLLVKELILVAFSLSALLPVYFMLVTSFKTQLQFLVNPMGLPSHWVFSNYSQAFSQGFLQWLMNTVVIAGGSVILTTLLASLAAFALAWTFRKPPAVLVALISILMMIPPIVMLIPLYQMASAANLIDTFVAVILIYGGLMMPFSAYMLLGFFRTVPREMLEAAAIDGAGALRIYWSVMLPLSIPSLLTLGVVNLLWSWSELLIAVTFLQSNSTRTLMVGISMFQSKTNLNVPLTMAGLVIATLPIVALYLFSQHYFIRGLTMGSIK